GVLPDVDSLRIPLRYLANLLTAGDEKPVKLALKRLLAMRVYKRAEHVDGAEDLTALEDVGLSKAQADEMYRYLAIADYEDRFVSPPACRDEALSDACAERNGCGFSSGSGCGGGEDDSANMYGGKKHTKREDMKSVQVRED